MHIWSQKHPEKAIDVLAENVQEHAWGVTGVKEIQEICYAMHDAFENYHLEVLDTLSQGTLDDGKWVHKIFSYSVFQERFPSDSELMVNGSDHTVVLNQTMKSSNFLAV